MPFKSGSHLRLILREHYSPEHLTRRDWTDSVGAIFERTGESNTNCITASLGTHQKGQCMTRTGQHQRCISAIHWLEASGALALGAMLVALVIGTPAAQAQTYTVVYRFKGSPTDVARPLGRTFSWRLGRQSLWHYLPQWRIELGGSVKGGYDRHRDGTA
jgi:hypothetical protein